MPNYTADEIQASVEKLVRASIRRPYDALGTRRVDTTFGDIQEAVASVFVLYPSSPYYLLSLGASRLKDSVAAEALLLDQILAAIDAVGRKVLPIGDVTTLFNAQAALRALAAASVSRTNGFTDITTTAEYQRFDSNASQFLDGPGSNVRSDGQVVQTPNEARALLPSLMAQLQSAHAALVRKVKYLAGGLADYNSVNLPSLVASSILTRSAAVMGTNAQALDALSQEDRLKLVRQTVLDVLATKAVVRTFGSFTGAGEFFAASGLVQPFADTAHPGTPAALDAVQSDAYAVVAGVNDVLTLALDGAAPFSTTLAPSFLASLTGTVPELQGLSLGYVIDATNDSVEVRVGATLYTATLIHGPDAARRTAAQIAAEVQAVLPAGMVMEAVGSPGVVRLRCTDAATQVPVELAISFESSTSAAAGALRALGFVANVASICRPTPTSELVADLKGKVALATVGIKDLTPTATGAAHASSIDPNLVTFASGPIAPLRYNTLSILDGPNSGDYLVASFGPGPLDVTLFTDLPQPMNGAVPAAFNAVLLSRVPSFASKNTGTTSSLTLTGTASSLFFAAPPAQARGTTSWVRLQNYPRGLQPGDILETFATNYQLLTDSFDIVSADETASLLQITPELRNNVTWTLTPQPPPFARLRVGHAFDFLLFKSELDAWLVSPQAQALFFTDLNRLINPLLVNQNPTAVELADAKAKVRELYGLLTEAEATSLNVPISDTLEFSLLHYKVSPVSAVDVLIRAYKEKGSDRATDILIQGQFSVFFGLTLDTSSYAGAFQSAMRDIAVNDLAVNKTNRPGRKASQLSAQVQSPDYEFTSSDIDNGLKPDPPGLNS